MSSDSSRKRYIYVLKLQQDKWYIGSTTNLSQRIAQHNEGTGSVWTSHFPPIDLFDCQEQRDGWHEENLTKEYMSRYGIENVRGGPYTAFNLKEEDKETIQRALDAFAGACYFCGSTGHVAADCSTAKFNEGGTVQYAEYYSRQACFRCGRPGHYISECYAETDAHGQLIDSPKRNKLNEGGTAQYAEYYSRQACFRCERPGHYISECYAETDVHGQLIDSPKRIKQSGTGSIQGNKHFDLFQISGYSHARVRLESKWDESSGDNSSEAASSSYYSTSNESFDSDADSYYVYSSSSSSSSSSRYSSD
ncbi:hypothetical protein GpartN1_g3503.t1 [Galdieria partita]|uniref:Uncharacterized protein n=1 Tax=Galdieria partita TaxID=83374 RepID=A0A9C7PY99_9RHOD|nr:hypothetical protein GpartN1_g3503.t1 [Galdieria partita]